MPKVSDTSMKKQPGNRTILQNRYDLVKQISSTEKCKIYKGEDQHNDEPQEYLIKIWEYGGKVVTAERQALWNREVRTLSRLCSSPGAEDGMMLLHDAGIDKYRFAIVLKAEGGGFASLDKTLKRRKEKHNDCCPDWLLLNRHKDPAKRKILWDGLYNIAKAIQLMHEQDIIHRSIADDAVYFDMDGTPDSLRLAGFDWGVRFGEPNISGDTSSKWSLPSNPDGKLTGYNFDSDWFAFGILLARCFYDLGENIANDNKNKTAKVYQHVTDANTELSQDEKTLILELIDPKIDNRKVFGASVIRSMKRIIDGLSIQNKPSTARNTLLLTINTRVRRDLIDNEICATDIDPDAYITGKKNSPFKDYDLEHRVRLYEFINKDLKDAKNSKIYAVPGSKGHYQLKGENLLLKIRSFQPPRLEGAIPWRVAEVIDINGYFDGTSVNYEVLKHTVEVIPLEDACRKVEKGFAGHELWSRNPLPGKEKRRADRTLEEVRLFLQFTNQLEVIARDAEIFAYKILEGPFRNEDDEEIIRITDEKKEERASRRFFNQGENLVSFFAGKRSGIKTSDKKVLLTGTNSLELNIRRHEAEESAWTIVPPEQEETNDLTLKRFSSDDKTRPNSEGYIRNKDHFAQMRLIKRRVDAIRNLKHHAYLLRAMAMPHTVHIDTQDDLKQAIPDNEDGLDREKQEVLRNILQLRPIYLLQGPPGTGKTRLVAHLLRQILLKDPTYQILVTANDHEAVDVLKEKVQEVYKGSKKPLIAIRLHNEDELRKRSDSIESVTDGILDNANKELAAVRRKSAIQEEWLELLKRYHADGKSGLYRGLKRLVETGAHITYSTTTSGNLEELAKGRRSFDWSIIEEAGKIHGFSLVLPLQTGYRWLLLGDQQQLEPFYYREFYECLDRPDEIRDVLDEIGTVANNRRYLDFEWNNTLGQDPDAFMDFCEVCKDWLRTFDKMFRVLSPLEHTKRLGRQYRMHPAIGNLVSEVFYEAKLQNATEENGKLKDGVKNPFSAPRFIAGETNAAEKPAVVWLDVPWEKGIADIPEKYPEQTREWNQLEITAIQTLLQQLKTDQSLASEVTIAVLTPYTKQREELNTMLGRIHLSKGLKLQSKKFARRHASPGESWANTVDSFQGNEADVVILSLVRNKNLPARGEPKDIRFIAEKGRLNVMLSRAKRMLVIAGCWEFFNETVKRIAENNSEAGHFKKVINLLEEYFELGKAVKVSLEELRKAN